MAAESTALRDPKEKTRRARGPTKTFPLVAFEKVATFAKSIADYGIAGEIQRLTLLDKLNMSSGSGVTRNLIIGGRRYGLTVGSYNAASLRLTADGAALFAPGHDDDAKARIAFDLSIAKIDPFGTVYERIKEKRLPDESVLNDEFARTGLAPDDASKAAGIFVDNLQYLGLIQGISGSDHVRDVEAVILQPPRHENTSSLEKPAEVTTAASASPGPPKGRDVSTKAKEPSVHIDVQIHIDSNATAEQVDQVFASMAKHLYGR